MSKLKVPALIIGIFALLIALYLGFSIKQYHESIKNKLNATIKERYGDKVAEEAKIKPIEDKISIFDRNVIATQRDLQNTEGSLTNTRAKLADTEKERDTIQATLTKTASDLATTQDELKKTKDQLAQVEKERDKVKSDLVLVQKELAETKVIAAQVEDLKQQLVELSKQSETTKKELKEAKDLNGDLTNENNELNKKIVELKTISPQLAGVVLKSDPAWSFVVINLGVDDHIQLGSEFFVYRGEKLIGKVRVTSREKNMSLADVLSNPDIAKTGDIVAGDRILYKEMVAEISPTSNSTASENRTVITPAPVSPAPATIAPTPKPRFIKPRPSKPVEPAPKGSPIKNLAL